MAGETIKVHGLNEFVRALKQADGDVKKEFTRGLRDAAKVVAAEAKDVASSEGLMRTGALIRGIGVSVRGTKAFVKDKTTRNGFSYPGLYEFKRGRPFMQPALERKTTEVVSLLEDAVGRAIDRF